MKIGKGKGMGKGRGRQHRRKNIAAHGLPVLCLTDKSHPSYKTSFADQFFSSIVYVLFVGGWTHNAA